MSNDADRIVADYEAALDRMRSPEYRAAMQAAERKEAARLAALDRFQDFATNLVMYSLVGVIIFCVIRVLVVLILELD